MSKCNDDTELEITCPHCGQKVNVYANCIHFKSANAMVVEDMNGEQWTDWDSLEIDGDWEYRCFSCSEVVAQNLNELAELARKEA